MVTMMNPEFVEALVPSACGSTWALDTSAPLQLVRFGYIISYNALALEKHLRVNGEEIVCEIG
jgi:hypothetical protein